MGYTHYFEQKKHATDDQWQAICEDFNKLRTAALIADRHLPPIQLELDDPAPVQVNRAGILFNGVGDDGHETMVLRKDELGFNFCKTARKPYDIWVTALLTLAHAHAPGVWDIDSDGDPDDWEDGVNLVRIIRPGANNPILDRYDNDE